MGADLGGTSLLPPLQDVLSYKPRDGIPRQLFVLTDGEVGNSDECIQFVRDHSGNFLFCCSVMLFCFFAFLRDIFFSLQKQLEFSLLVFKGYFLYNFWSIR